MYESKKWVAVTKDSNGKIEIFHKWIDAQESWTVEAFRQEVEGWNVTILAMFREDDVAMVCSL